MNGIYGNMLLFFPEQRVALTAYQMIAKINGGFSKVGNSEISFSGIIQNTGGARLKEQNGNLVKGGALELWTENGTALDGYFMEWESEIYRINASNKWQREGGYYRYALEKVVGNNGTESDDAAWNFGANSFS